MRRLAVPAAVLAVAAAVAGCSSDGPDAGPPTSAAPTPPTPASTVTTTAPATTVTPTPSTTPSTTTRTTTTTVAPPPSSPSSTATPSGPKFTTTCAKLSVRVIPGGAVRGAEIAAVQYVNDGRTACTITGVPTAQLLRNGREVGSESQPTGGKVVRPYRVAPGDVGESLLQDFSSCNAPLSTAVRVTVPAPPGGRVTTTVQPAQLRACTLRLAPVGRPS